MANVKIAILGAGAYGTALGLVLTGGVPGIRAGRSRTVTLWTDDAEVSREIRERRLNSRHLAGVTLPRALAATTDLTEALTGAEIIVFTLPSQAVRQVATLVGSLLIDPQASPPDGAGAGGEPPLFIGAANGLEEISRLRMSQVIAAELPEPHRPRILGNSNPNTMNLRLLPWNRRNRRNRLIFLSFYLLRPSFLRQRIIGVSAVSGER